MIELAEKDGTVTFKVRVQPGASRNLLAGVYAGALKLKIAAPPVRGKANEECRRYLAKLLDVPTSAVEIISGETSKNKTVRVYNISSNRVREALAGL
ncbi:MAG: DUF167 domain-containing protein [Blastocatellia bacterium]|nr:DUF167 domain-containing protein [Blastocatellia bacterium]